MIKITVATILILLSGCSSASKNISEKDIITAAVISNNKWGGGYYLDDGPGNNPPANLDSIPDAIPKTEPLRKANMQPYVVFGKTYQPLTKLEVYKKRGTATWYGRRYHGKKTAIGEIYDMYAMTAAHPTLPLPSYARVTNLTNGRSIVVRINDRGPFLSNRIIDLSYTAAHKLDILKNGSAEVEVESIIPESATPTVKSPQDSAINQSSLTTINPENIYLQLGAFGTAGNANNFLSNLQVALPWLVETLGITEKDGLFKIKVGPFSDRMLAMHTANEIAQQIAIKPMLIIK